MKQSYIFILCFTWIVKLGLVSSAAGKDDEQRHTVNRENAEDLDGSETSAKLFNLGSLFPTYSTYPSYRPGGYPTTGGGYYPSSSGGGYYPGYNPAQGNYPTTGYYPTGTNILGSGYGGYPTQSYYPGYSQSGYNTRVGGYGSSGSGRSGGGYGGYTGYGGYGGYGGNGGIRSYYGYNNQQYSGKRNLGYGYYPDTDRYGFYRTPSSNELSVHRGYN